MTAPPEEVLKPWFPSLRRRPSPTLRLICFPFAGGGASAYMRWQDNLPSWIEVWALEYPAHETRHREPPAADALGLAAEIAARIAACVDGPFAMFGHSMGSLVAFETARILQREYGLAPVILFVSGFSAPQLPPFRPPVHKLPEPAFRDEIRLYGGTPEEILADEDFMAFVSPLLRNDLRLAETYAHPGGAILDYPVIAFGGYDDAIVPWHRLLAWSEVTGGRFAAHFFPGGHFFIKDAVQRIGRMIGGYLEASGDGPQFAVPEPDEVHLWSVAFEVLGPREEELRASLSRDELDRADAFVQPADRRRSIASRAALRDLLAHYGGIRPDAIAFSYSEEEKPSAPALRPLDFNVSHSGDHALIAVVRGQAIGVDVEQMRAGVYTPDIATQVATFEENRQLGMIAPDQRERAFFDLWVRKEADLKRLGIGFTGEPKAVHAGFSNRIVPSTHARHGDGRIQSFTLAEGYPAAVSAGRTIGLVTIRSWCPAGEPL